MSEATLREALVRLPRATRQRLERMTLALDELGAPDFAALATTSLDPVARERAITAADDVLTTMARRDEVLDVVRAIREWALRAYARELDRRIPQAIFGLGSAPSVDDRLAFLGSLEPAVVAVCLWDDLDDEDRAELLGPWAHAFDEAVDGDGAG